MTKRFYYVINKYSFIYIHSFIRYHYHNLYTGCLNEQMAMPYQWTSLEYGFFY